MSVIDYSKWNKIIADIEKEGGLDSDNEDNPKRRSSDGNAPLELALKSPAAQNKPCQCVRVFRRSERPFGTTTQDYFFERIIIPKHHPMLVSGTALISPVSKKIGIPLIIYLEDPLHYPLSKPNVRSNYENQIITYLLIKPSNGFAPIKYQDGVGTALVARADHRPLAVGLLTTIHAYNSMLLSERYGSGDDHKVQHSITPNDFKKFAHKFVNKKKSEIEKDWNFTVFASSALLPLIILL
ncbi:hypothetical protein BDA99DRAFT_559328 [Phascolomyces articulosus]|uniref:Uncharacterized protein n=1 Tax=Phascolomyces articulosus TaxID=60185 RepID=A0AAD5PF25_9FUNG|nr:hypothetical protein BDA99DRAFT_559328 [Phascolomyces articulosus]